MTMLKHGFRHYWLWIPIIGILGWYVVIHMRSSGGTKVRTGPVLTVTPSLDPGLPILSNISHTISRLHPVSRSGMQTSASLNPVPR